MTYQPGVIPADKIITKLRTRLAAADYAAAVAEAHAEEAEARVAELEARVAELEAAAETQKAA